LLAVLPSDGDAGRLHVEGDTVSVAAGSFGVQQFTSAP
jgi:hypothetical protein